MNPIKKLFKGKQKNQNSQAYDEKDLAAAALLVEAACMDGELGHDERAVIDALLTSQFKLSSSEAESLFEEALSAQADATHLMRFTRTIKDNYSEEQRIQLIEMLWQVAYADGIIHPYEDNLIRRIGGLIYVSDFERGEAKKRVRQRLDIQA